jgi:thiol-disulfide isomerase/thioredoxin
MRRLLPIFVLIALTSIFLTACGTQSVQDAMEPEVKIETEKMDSTSNEMTADESADSMHDTSMKETLITEDDEPSEQKSEEMSKTETKDLTSNPGEVSMDEDGEDSMLPDWFSVPLTNARNGETFSIMDFKGKVVLVETLAMWCSNCLKQQQQVYDLHQLIDSDNFVSVGIDIDPNENSEALNTYVRNNGFSWYYAVAPEQVAREIGNLYGSQFLNPPSTPMLIIDSHGEVHILPFGIKDAKTLLDTLQPFLEESM